MHNRKMQILATVVFCLFIGVFCLMYILFPKTVFSEKEKRVLASMPEVSLQTVFNGSFESGFETWMSDHVPGRDALVNINARYEQFSGRNGLGGVIADGNKLYAAAAKMDETAVRGKLDRILKFAETTDIPTDVMLVPTSGYIFEDTLPLHAPYHDGELAALTAEVLGEKAGFIWPEELLRSLREEHLYYDTDHHFTSRGAYELCRLYTQHAGAAIPEMDGYEIETHGGFFGSMYAKAGLWNVPSENIEIWRSKTLGEVQVTFDDRESADTLFFTDHLDEMDKYPVFLDGNHGLVVIETGRDTGKNLLLIRDSFGHCFAPFAADAFDRIVLVDLRYYRKSVSDLAREMEIDRTLVLYGTETFLTDTNFAWLK